LGFFLVALLLVLSAAYGLVFWAYRAERDRSARVGLYLVYGFPGILLVVAGLALSSYGKDLGPLLLFLGLGLTLPLVKSFRKAIARYTPIDPDSPVDMSALSIFLGVLGFLIASLLFPIESDSATPIMTVCPPVCGDTTSLEVDPTDAVDYGQLIVQLLAWVCLAYVSVGTGLRRKFAESNLRLGLARPTVRIVSIALGFVFIAMFVNGLGGALTALFQPDTSSEIQKSLQELTGDVQSPLGALILGVSAGVGEELFFRGALQPKFGLFLTSVCFALLHTNYGFSFVTLGVFGMGIVFGLMRKRYGTVAPMITHGVVNLIAVLIQTYT